MKKRMIKLASLMAAVSVLLSGCSYGVKNNLVEIEEPVQISFSWWGNDERHIYTMEGVDYFQNQNPDIHVSYQYGEWNGFEQHNRVYMRSGTEADVMQINFSWLDEYSPDGDGYYDINLLSDYIDLSSYSEDDLAYGTVNGKLNAVPIAFNTFTIYYCKELYDKYGLSVPADWDDLFAAAEKMAPDGIYQLGVAKKQLYMLITAYYEQESGKKSFSDDGEFLLDESDVEEMLRFYKKLVDSKVIMPLDKWDKKLLSTGTVGGSMMWISDADKYCEYIEEGGFTPVIGEYPGVEESGKLSGWYRKPATLYAISKRTEHPKEAARLLDYLVNSPDMAGFQKTEKGVPASSRAVDALMDQGLLDGYGYEATQKMSEESNKMDVMIPAMENSTVLDAFKSGADSYYYGKSTISEAAAQIVDQIKK